jgi:hypothetical protein
MRNFPLQGCGSAHGDTSSLLHAPRKSRSHGLASSLGVRLFVNEPKVFGVNAYKQLRDTLARDSCLDIQNDAITKSLAMRSVFQFAISPQPKYRSSMRHFISIPLPEEPAASEGRCFRYVTLFDASIDSYKRYRRNDLAADSVSAELLTGSQLAQLHRAAGLVLAVVNARRDGRRPLDMTKDQPNG